MRTTRQGVRDLNDLPGKGAVPARRRAPVSVWHSCSAESTPYRCLACCDAITIYDSYACTCGRRCRICGRSV